MYSKEEQLEIYARIGVTKEAYEVLRRIKSAEKISMAKIVSEMILKLKTNPLPKN